MWVIACCLAAASSPAWAEDVPLKIKFSSPRGGSWNGHRLAVAFDARRSSHRGGGPAAGMGVGGENKEVTLVLKRLTVEDVFYELTEDALNAAGFRAVQGREDGLPTLLVVLEDLEVEGFTEYTVSLYLEFELLSSGDEELLWDGSAAAEGEVRLQWGVGELWKGYRGAFEEALDIMTRHFESSEFLEGLPVQSEPAAVVEDVVEDVVEEAPVVTPPVEPVDTPLLAVVQTYYAYQGTTMTDDQREAGEDAVRQLLAEGFVAAGLERAVVQVHREIPGARTMDFERIVPAYVRAMGDTFKGP